MGHGIIMYWVILSRQKSGFWSAFTIAEPILDKKMDSSKKVKYMRRIYF